MSSNHLHEKAVEIVGRYKRAEAELIDILQQIDHVKAFRELGCTSLFVYAVEKLGLAEGTAYNFINVARKAVVVPALKQAIANHEITVSKAKKIVPVITQENQSRWIGMAKTLPQHKLEREVARVSPKAATYDRATYVTGTRMQLTMGISEELMAQFKRVQDLESQRNQKAVDYESTLNALIVLYLYEKDPVRKNHPRLAKLAKPVAAGTPATVTTRETPEVGATPAPSATPANPAQRVLRPVIPPAPSAIPVNPVQRVLRPVITPAPSATPVNPVQRVLRPVIPPAPSAAPINPPQRVLRPVIPRTLTSSRKNFVLKAHAGRCSHRDGNGTQCAETRWLHVHHRRPRAEGGTNTIENLTVLCAAHHRMEHARQAGFEFD